MSCVQKAMPVEKTRKEKMMNVTMMKTARRHIMISFINVILFGRHFDALSAFWLLLALSCAQM